VERDLEAQMTIVTKCKDLRSDLHDEQKRLFDSSSQVTRGTFEDPERKVPNWIKLVVATARNFF
jgi:hypothetical protein